MPESLTLPAAQLVGNFCETLFYGIYLVTCCFCARTLFLVGNGPEERRVRIGEVRWVMTIAAFVLFVLCTFDVVIGLLHNFQAFLARPVDQAAVFFETGNWIDLAQDIDQALVLFLSDFLLIYRCWIVYGRRWLPIVPSLAAFLVFMGFGIRLCTEATATSVINRSDVGGDPWRTAVFGASTFQNMLTTSILIWRIWQVDRQNEKYTDRSDLYRPRHLRKVMWVIGESGAVYAVMMCACTIISAVQNNLGFPFAYMVLQTAGIVFNVIIFRSSARRDSQFSEFGQSTLGSLQFARDQNTVQDIELAIPMKSNTGRHSGGPNHLGHDGCREPKR